MPDPKPMIGRIKEAMGRYDYVIVNGRVAVRDRAVSGRTTSVIRSYHDRESAAFDECVHLNALAVLAELRSLSDAAIVASYEACERDDQWCIEDDRDFLKAWRAAIDAIKEGK